MGRARGARELEVEFDIQRTAFLGFINYCSPIQAPAKGLFGQSEQVAITENRIEMPVFDDRKIKSTVSLSPGQYLAIGGLARENFDFLEKATQERTPGEDHGFLALIRVDAVPAKEL